MSIALHALTNGRYTAFLTAAGTGYSTWNALALTRWRGDPIEDSDGFFLYLRDKDSGVFWSLGQQPVFTPVGQRASQFSESRAELGCSHEGIEATVEVTVPATMDGELRRVTLRNVSERHRRIELTTYAEVVLNVPAADATHPAFSKLFVQTEFDAASGALLARRRPRAAGESICWLVHALIGGGVDAEPSQYETDRARFIGRGYSMAAPKALVESEPLSGTVGNVLDPIMSLRRTVELAAGDCVQVTVLLGAAVDRTAVLALLSG